MEERRVVTLKDVNGKDAITIERMIDPETESLVVRITPHRIKRALIPLSELTLADAALTSDLHQEDADRLPGLPIRPVDRR